MQNKVGFAGGIHFLKQTFEALKTIDMAAKFQKRQLLHQKKADYISILIGMLSIFSCYVYSNDNLNL